MPPTTDRQAAERAGVHVPRDHDHGEKYDGHDALFPRGWDDLDPGRFDVEDKPGRCHAAWGKLHDRGYNAPWRWWCVCGDCGSIIEARSEAALQAKKAEHAPEEP